jgi:uncharacterized protein (TIGR00255 family)
MTGFGTAEGLAGSTRVNIEIRTVNHRFFNPSLKLPPVLARWEPELREQLRQKIVRGHVGVVLQLDKPAIGSELVDSERFAAGLEQLRQLSQRHNLAQPLLSDVLRMPGVVSAPSDAAAAIDTSILNQLLERALGDLDTMRRGEGGRLANHLRERLAVFADALGGVEARAIPRLREQQLRLQESVSQLLGGAITDEQRIAQEIAIMAERLDIAEETTRLRSHCVGFLGALAGDHSEPVGKRLGFLLQEMLREVNTIGSKGADAEILRYVLGMKEELERMREQAENIE